MERGIKREREEMGRVGEAGRGGEKLVREKGEQEGGRERERGRL